MPSESLSYLPILRQARKQDVSNVMNCISCYTSRRVFKRSLKTILWVRSGEAICWQLSLRKRIMPRDDRWLYAYFGIMSCGLIELVCLEKLSRVIANKVMLNGVMLKEIESLSCRALIMIVKFLQLL